jgi:hypothetical protein
MMTVTMTHRDEIRSRGGGVVSSGELFEARDWDPPIVVANICGDKDISDLSPFAAEPSGSASIDQNIRLDLSQSNVSIDRGSNSSNLRTISDGRTDSNRGEYLYFIATID